MISIVEFANYTQKIASSRTPRDIAEEFVAVVRDAGVNPYIRGVLKRLGRSKAWDNQDLLRFEKGDEALRVGINGKTVAWLAPIHFDLALVPRAPVVSPLGMKRLALWIDHLIEEERCGNGAES